MADLWSQIAKRDHDILNNIASGIVITTIHPDGRIGESYFSDRWLEMFSMDEDEAVRYYSADPTRGIHADDRIRTLDAFTSHMDTGRFIIPDYRHITGDGSYLWVSVDASRIVDADGSSRLYMTYRDVTDEHRLREERDNAERRFHAAIENSDLFVWEYDIGLRQAICQPYAAQIFGVPDLIEDFPDSIIEDGMLAGDSARLFVDAIEAIRGGADSSGCEVSMRDGTGEHRWLSIHFDLERDDEGEPLRAISIVHDITRQKDLERKYREQSGYSTALAQGAFITFRMDLTDNTYSDVTGIDDIVEIVEALHTTASGLMSWIVSHTARDEEGLDYRRRLDRDYLLEAFDRGETMITLVNHDLLLGMWIHTNITLLQNPYTGHVEAVQAGFDITEKRLTQLALDALLVHNYINVGIVEAVSGMVLLIAAPGGIVKTPENGTLDEQTRQFCDSIQERFPGDAEYRQTVAALQMSAVLDGLRDSDTYEFRAQIYDRDNASRTYRFSFDRIDDENTMILFACSDISDIVADEQRHHLELSDALDEARSANRAKSDFLSHMSHEIRTPLNAIIGMTALAKDNVSDPEAVSDDLSKIEVSARFLLSLVNDVLDMSRIESGRMTLSRDAFSFADLIHDIGSIIYNQAQAKGIRFDTTVAGPVEDSYIGDRTKLQQVIVNILGNAVKFTSPEGRIAFEVEQVGCSDDIARLRFTMSDTGCGIDERFLPHIFDAFAQEHSSMNTSFGGTGLGLAISRSLVEMMGGTIDVRSTKGVGTTFIVEVNLEIGGQALRRMSLLRRISARRLRALIVDDDVIICQHVLNILTEMGITAEWVDSGLAAVEKVQAHTGRSDFYDLILLDWKMPGMDGIETTRRIRAVLGENITIIIMTAYDWSLAEHRARQAGVDLFMDKPVMQSSMLDILAHLYADDATGTEKAVEGKTYDFGGRHVLLVEDNALNIEVAKRLIESRNAQVDVAQDGQQAIDLFSAAAPYHYSMILMDVNMPVMDGLTATRRIRGLDRADAATTPIVAMTADAFEEDIKKTKAAGMDAHLAKPIEPALLFETLNRAMSGPQDR